MKTRTIVLDKKSRLVLFSNFYSSKKSNLLYQALCEEIDWQQGEIRLFGKAVKEPRLTSFFADEGVVYKYSGRLNNGKKWTKLLQKIKNDVEKAAQFEFNSLLLNYYRNQKDSMGWHRDNEKELGPKPIVASLTFGQERTFCVRKYGDKTQLHKVILPSGSLLLMLGNTQNDWEHCIKKEARALQGRINLTFRKVIKS